MTVKEFSKAKQFEINKRACKIAKQISGFTIRLVIVLLFLAVPITICLAIGACYNEYKANKVVEPYCAIKYKHDVEAYKSCKGLTTVQLLENITSEVDIHSQVPELPLAY